MDVLGGLLALLIAGGLLLAAPILALLALARANQAVRELGEMRARLDALARRQSAPAAPPASDAAARPAPVAAAMASAAPATPVPPAAFVSPAASPAASAAPPAASAAAPGRAARVAPAAREAPRSVLPGLSGLPGAPRSAPERQFATQLGPKILVGAGGLAVVVFLGLFVRYAWENDWVGPLGRVLSAALFSLGLLAGGLRTMAGRYRPLGQGLAAAGLSGLYVTAWAAHAVYALVPRGVAGALLVAVTVGAVLLALGRDARLLAGLAWVGGYLAPVLVSTGEDRALGLFAYLLLLGAGAVWLDRLRPWDETLLLAALGTLLLYGAWYDAHFTADRLGVAAGGLVLLAGLFALAPRRDGDSAALLAAVAVAASGWAALGMAGEADRPLAVFALLFALALLAALAAERWRWSQPLAAALAALGVLAWHQGFFVRGREPEALGLGLGVAACHVGLLASLGRRARALDVPGALAHVAASSLAYATLERTLAGRPGEPLFLALLGLAAAHLGLGLLARARGGDPLRVRLTLALAACFLTLALPLRLGRSGTTLAFAVEGVLLVWLGVREHATLARAFGYGVVVLAVCRLFARHLPLHTEPFRPLLNPELWTWLLVIAALGLARRLARRAPEQEQVAWLDGAAALLFAPLALALLFGVLTAETASFFDQLARAAVAAGDGPGALRAERQAGLAVSVLWTLVATGLLAAGLALRSLPSFYTAYALFALTAAKVVLLDLARLPTLYRMLSFLALGLLLLAGAWLNLRFRERLAGGPGDGPGDAPGG